MNIYSKELRSQNAKAVTTALANVTLDFNSLIFAFMDIIQSSFMTGAFMGKSKEEREVMNDQIVAMTNRLIDQLNEDKAPLLIDMIVLSNLMMDAINNATAAAMEAQQENKQ